MTAFSSALVASFLAMSSVPAEGGFTLRWPPTGSGSRLPFTQPFVNKLSLGHWGGCMVNDTNSLVCWGFIDKRTTVDTPVNITNYVTSSVASLRVTNVGVGGYGLCYLSTNPSACTCLNTGHYPFSCPAAWASSAVSLAHGQDPWVCSLNSAGAISCVGGPYSTPPITPPGGSGWSALAAGWYHGCAVSSVGALNCWGGAFTSGEQNVPPGLGVNVSTISTRDPYTCALLQDQTVRCWGGTWCPSQPTIPPQVANGAFKTVAISAGGGAPPTGPGNMCRGCALNSTGYLVCWGSNAIATFVPSYLQGDVVAIDSGGTFFNCVVRASTAGVECWLLNTPTTPFTPSTAAMAIAVPQGGRVGALCSSIAAVVSSWDVPTVCIPPTPSPTGTPSATPTASGTPTRSATPSFTATGTPTPSITPSLSSSPSTSSSSGSSASTTPTITPSSTSTPSITPSASPTPTPTTPISPSPTSTFTPTPSSTLSFGLSPSPTPTSSSTTTISASGTPGGNLPPSTVTSTPTPSASASPPSAPSNNPNANNANSDASTTPLVPGAIAGIAIAGVAVLGGIGAGLVCCLLQGRRGKGKLPVAASVAAGGGGVQAAQQQHVVSNPLGGSAAPVVSTTQPPLPHGWVEMSDETGDIWYEGPGGESVWERPTVL